MSDLSFSQSQPSQKSSRKKRSKFVSKKQQQTQVSKDQWLVEFIYGKKLTENGVYYLVKWQGFSFRFSTWEPIANLESVQDMCENFEIVTSQIQFNKLKEKENQSDGKQSHKRKLIAKYLNEKDAEQFGTFNFDIPEVVIKHIQARNEKQKIETCLIDQNMFKIQWKKRLNGVIPKSSYFTYNILEEFCPELLLNYIEKNGIFIQKVFD